MEEVMKDERFKHIAKDPRFKRIPQSQRKVKIDKRFQSMFEDKRFKVKYTVDKRGRPINKTSSEDLQKFYQLTSGSEDEESDTEEEKDFKESKKLSLKQGKLKTVEPRIDNTKPGASKKHKLDKEVASSSKKKSKEGVEEEEDSDVEDDNEEESEDGDEESSEGERSSDEEVDDNIKTKLKDLSVDYARGEGAIMSDSSSDELTEDEEDEEEDVVHGWGELDRDAERVEESTRRLALCNMDWDRIRATDIMVLLNSFIPAGGLIHSVTVYPSEYGMERMKVEKEQGPLELYGGNEGSDEDEDKDDQKYQMEKLRQYQLNRLKYFYAVIECDTVATADHLYKECDGREYESSATRLDLRFVPDDTTFDQEPRERCTEMPDIRKYKPRNFLTTALQQSKVDMTWDETDPDRAALTSRVASGDIDDDDLKAYLASSTEDESDESDEDESKIDKYKKLAEGKAEEESGDDEKQEEEEEEEESGDESGDDSDDAAINKYRRALQSTAEDEEEEKKDVEMEVTWDLGLKKKAEEAVKKKMEEKEERTPFEEMMHRRREKKKEKMKQKAEEQGEDSDESDDYIPADVDLNDSYFKEEYDKLEKGKKKKKKNAEETEEDVERRKWAQLNSSKKARQKKTRKELEEEAAKESNFKVDVKDERFSALYTSHLFNIDPTDPNFRKTSGVEALINEKLDRRSKQPEKPTSSQPPNKKSKLEDGKASEKNLEDNELSALVKSVKSKAQNLQNSKKRKLKDGK